MKRTLLAAICFIFTSGMALAQTTDTTYWTKGGVGTLTFSQVALTNWAAGGDNSVSLNGYFNVFANYAKDKSLWQNDLILGYGLINQGGNGVEKTDDRINLVTQYGHKIKGDKLYWSNMLDFRTQFAEGVNAEGTVISKFMAPGYLLVSTGIDWKPSDKFSLAYSPIAGKFTFVTDQDLANQGAFGVEGAVFDDNGNIITEGSTSRSEIGSFLKVKYKSDIAENVNLETKLEMFANYIDNFGNVDVAFDNALVMKVNDWLTVNWIISLIYDDDINIEIFDDNDVLEAVGPRTQFKSVFGAGLAFNFGAKKE
ncbi:MAG: DUF3078 domain-containing protein [Cyclobacteriaceae bacterium]